MSKARKLADLLDSSGDVAGGKIADDSINSEHFVDGGIDDAHIGDLAATKLTGTIADARLPATLPAKSGVNLTALNATNLGSGTVPTARLGSGTASNTTFLRGDGSWQVVSSPLLDSPVISGTLSVIESLTVTHTISNWSDDVSYTITPTNCTVGSVNSSGQFVITHTSGTPSYTIKATTASLGLDDSATVTKNITLITVLSAPTLSSPADAQYNTNVVYTITSTNSNDDKLILDLGASTFTYGSVSHGSGSKVGNTVEVTGFTTNNPAVTLQFTAGATYSVTAKAVKIDGTYGTSANSSADSILITSVYSGAQAVADAGLSSGSYTINNYTTGSTDQSVYCWIGVNGDNWQKFSPYGTHIGMANGKTTEGTVGSHTAQVEITTFKPAGDWEFYASTPGAGGAHMNTVGMWGNRGFGNMHGLKIMTTSVRQNTSSSGALWQWHWTADTARPSSYGDGGNASVQSGNAPDVGERGLNITTFTKSGTNITMAAESWQQNSKVPADYEISDSASTLPASVTSTDHTNSSGSFAYGSNVLWHRLLTWTDNSPNTKVECSYWVNT